MPDLTIDLRSDVCTSPTPRMREAMCAAWTDGELAPGELVDLFERTCAERFGKEAGILLPTVTMGNVIACLAYCRPGDQMLVDVDAHVFRNENGGLAKIAGVLPRALPRRNAVPDIDAVSAELQNPNPYGTPHRLLWVENTHAAAGGAIASPTELERLRAICGERDIAIHVDGSRVFNAAVSLNIPVAELTANVDSVSVGIAKGLGCPAGCVLVGSRDFIDQAHVLRRMLGGALKSAAGLAAAGMVALRSMVDRLHEDHHVARQLAEIVSATPGLCLDADVVTNIVRIDTTKLGRATHIVQTLSDYRVACRAHGPFVMRAVTHRHVTIEHLIPIRRAFAALAAVHGASVFGPS